jgi:hypothetical protein
MTEEQVADGVGVFHTSASALVGSGQSLAAHQRLVGASHPQRPWSHAHGALDFVFKIAMPELEQHVAHNLPRPNSSGEAYDIQSDKRRRKDGKLEGLGVTSLLSRHVTETCRAVAGPATKYIPT